MEWKQWHAGARSSPQVSIETPLLKACLCVYCTLLKLCYAPVHARSGGTAAQATVPKTDAAQHQMTGHRKSVICWSRRFIKWPLVRCKRTSLEQEATRPIRISDCLARVVLGRYKPPQAFSPKTSGIARSRFPSLVVGIEHAVIQVNCTSPRAGPLESYLATRLLNARHPHSLLGSKFLSC